MKKVLMLVSAFFSLSLLTSCAFIQDLAAPLPVKVGNAAEKEVNSFTLKKLGQERYDLEGCSTQAANLGSDLEKILNDRLKTNTDQKFVKETIQELCRFGVGKIDGLANLASKDYRCLALAGAESLKPILLPICDKI